MIPILYPSVEKNFTTNGLGGLSDAIYCDVAEERNGAYELEMEYPIQGRHFSDIQMGRFIFAKPSDDAKPQPFAIYSISKPINGRCTINAEHLSYRLNYIPVMPFSANSLSNAFLRLDENAVEECPFTFQWDFEARGQYEQKSPSSMRARLGGEQGSILQTYGGEYEWDMWYVKLHKQRGDDNGVVIRYGKNLTDLTQEESIADAYTGICPYWAGTDEAGNDVVVTIDNAVVKSGINPFSYERTITKDYSDQFDSMPTKAELEAKAQADVNKYGIGVPSVNLQVSFTELWESVDYQDREKIEKISLCDTVTILFEELGVSAKAKVIRTVYDSLTERYKSLELGDTKSTLAGTIASQDASISSLQSSGSGRVSIATTLSDIHGGTLSLGGYDNRNGKVNIYDAEEQTIGYLDNTGIHLNINGTDEELGSYLSRMVSSLNNYENTVQLEDMTETTAQTIVLESGINRIDVVASFYANADGIRSVWIEDAEGHEIDATYTVLDSVNSDATIVQLSYSTGVAGTYSVRVYQNSGTTLETIVYTSVLRIPV